MIDVLNIILYIVLAYITFSIMRDAGKLLFRLEQNQFKVLQMTHRLNGFLYGLALAGIVYILT